MSMLENHIKTTNHFNGEYWSESHIVSFGELISGIIRDNLEPDYNWIEKRKCLRELYKVIKKENDEISINTGIDRNKLKRERFIFIESKIN